MSRPENPSQKHIGQRVRTDNDGVGFVQSIDVKLQDDKTWFLTNIAFTDGRKTTHITTYQTLPGDCPYTLEEADTVKEFYVDLVNKKGEIAAGGILGASVDGESLRLFVRNPHSGSTTTISEILEEGAQLRVVRVIERDVN